MTAAIRFLSVSHTTPLQWLFIAIPAASLAGALVWALLAGRGESPLERVASSLERVSTLPAWATAGLVIGMWSLAVAYVGFVWDVAWHIDFGRDRELFTVPHTMILVGLAGIGAAGLAAIALATTRKAQVWVRVKGLRIPASAVVLLALGAGAALGFPLDDLWHRSYGIDVTMWGPTHLLMIGGASLTPIALWLLYAESGGPHSQSKRQAHVRAMLASALVIGLSTLQLEFDLGVPQWQALYQPVLVMFAASIGLTAARAALGPGWALRIAARFLVLRIGLALIVGQALGHTVPHFPLYLGIALAIEAGFALKKSPLVRALASGVLAGSAGLASEWAFSHVFGREPWLPSLLPGIWAAAAIAVAGALLGAAIGGTLSLRGIRIAPAIRVGAAAAIVALLVVPFPRHNLDATATITTTPAGPRTAVVAPDRTASFAQSFIVTVTMSPPDAARDADWFVVNSWQGGGLRTAPLRQVSPGTYRAIRAVPTGGSWKSIVFLQKRDVLSAAPVSMPADPEYGLPAIPVKSFRAEPMVSSASLLIREAHGGAAWPAIVAYSGLGITVVVWLGLIAASFGVIARGVRNSTISSARLRRNVRRAAPSRMSW